MRQGVSLDQPIDWDTSPTREPELSPDAGRADDVDPVLGRGSHHDLAGRAAGLAGGRGSVSVAAGSDSARMKPSKPRGLGDQQEASPAGR